MTFIPNVGVQYYSHPKFRSTVLHYNIIDRLEAFEWFPNAKITGRYLVYMLISHNIRL